MSFFRRNQILLAILAVLILSSVLVVRQFMANDSAHVELREDFFVLQQRNETKAAERVYQLLVQQLPKLSTQALVNDLQRTSMLVETNAADVENLLWKFQVSVDKELQRRSKKRFADALERAQNP